MDLKLKKISYTGENNSYIYISIEARYAWEGRMFGDIIKVKYNIQKQEASITVRAKNPGVGTVIERLIMIFREIHLSDSSVRNQIENLITPLKEKLCMHYDLHLVEEVVEQYSH